MTQIERPQATPRTYLHEIRQPGWPVVLVTLAYVDVIALIGDLRPEHIAVACLIAAGWLAANGFRIAIRASAPIVLVIIGFDSLRYLRPLFVTAGRIHGCDLRGVELALFGVAPDTTIADYFNIHHSPGFDLFFAIPYAAFIYVAILYGATMYFRDRKRVRPGVWAYAFIYLIAFTCWMAFPAAPPWYIQAHGCVIDPGAGPSAAALMRVDAALGIHYFEGFYGRGPTAFGAMPSVHNAYPMLTLLVFWPIAGWKERVASILYALWMICASLYLDHHWLIDGFAGWATAALGVIFARLFVSRAAPNDRAIGKTAAS